MISNSTRVSKHKHHIIPRYEGGSDFAENLVELTVTQHAMWHFAEWQRKGNWQDFTAWKMISGETEEGRIAMRIALGGRNKGTKQGPLTPEQKERQRKGMMGRVFPPEVREKIAAPQRGRPKKKETCERMSVSAKAKIKKRREEMAVRLQTYLPLTEENLQKACQDFNRIRKSMLRSFSYYGLR